jgi:glutathione synthase/RimK-type ligase-like ATP-grasp enzyme
MKLYILTDYKGNFGSKWNAKPYRSGFDKDLLVDIFSKNQINVEFLNFSEIGDPQKYKNQYVLYTSSEDIKYKYKSYIEDIIYILELNGAILLPSYKYLRANNNKVFMSLLEQHLGDKWNKQLKSWVFGTYEDLLKKKHLFKYPVVVKKSEGSMSKGVFLAKNQPQLLSISKKISATKNLFQDLKDKFRPFKHGGYQLNSIYRGKFILQEFIPNLINDWKILVFGDKYYVLTRHIKDNDFRASGSHYNYLAGSKAIMLDGLLDFAKTVFDAINLPHLSIDVVYDGCDFHLIEYQTLYFGTSTHDMSDVFFTLNENLWEQIPNKITIEEVYVDSVVQFILKV